MLRSEPQDSRYYMRVMVLLNADILLCVWLCCVSVVRCADCRLHIEMRNSQAKAPPLEVNRG